MSKRRQEKDRKKKQTKIDTLETKVNAVYDILGAKDSNSLNLHFLLKTVREMEAAQFDLQAQIDKYALFLKEKGYEEEMIKWIETKALDEQQKAEAKKHPIVLAPPEPLKVAMLPADVEPIGVPVDHAGMIERAPAQGKFGNCDKHPEQQLFKMLHTNTENLSDYIYCPVCIRDPNNVLHEVYSKDIGGLDVVGSPFEAETKLPKEDE